MRDEEGNTVRLFKDDPLQSMPEWIEYPMKGRDDWEHIIKPRLDAGIPGRCPEGGELEAVRRPGQYAERDYPLGLWCGSFYGWPRSFLGVERISVMFYDDPGLIHEMCEHIADFVIAGHHARFCEQVDVRLRLHLGGHGRQGRPAVLAGARTASSCSPRSSA